MTRPVPELTRRDRIRNRIAAMVALILVWSLLWGSFSVGNLLTGALVATLVLVFFPLPPVTFAGRVRPWWVLVFLARFLVDLVVASVQVASLAFRPGKPASAIVAVRLRVHSDLNLTLVAEFVSLVPGSLIVEADRANGVLYIHLLGVTGPQRLERFRREVLELETRLVRAIGSRAELARVAAPITEGEGRV